MRNILPKSIRTLIEEFGKLPGFGPKSAQRLALFLLYAPSIQLKELGDAVHGLKVDVVFCKKCWNIAETDPCSICEDPTRDTTQLCVVEDILNVVALEKTRQYRGLYHVLHGALSPVEGVGPEQLKINELFKRIPELRTGRRPLNELILATNPSLEGEATALYIQKHMEDSDVRVTRIARGLPVGGDLDYADEVTLSRAMKGRGAF